MNEWRSEKPDTIGFWWKRSLYALTNRLQISIVEVKMWGDELSIDYLMGSAYKPSPVSEIKERIGLEWCKIEEPSDAPPERERCRWWEHSSAHGIPLCTNKDSGIIDCMGYRKCGVYEPEEE